MGEPVELVGAIARALDAVVVSTARVGGGDVAEAFRFELADGRTVFVKTHRDPPEHFFTTEATGLAWLGSAAAVPVPDVLSVSDGDRHTPPHLALGWIDGSGRPTTHSEAAFGRDLARLHRVGSPHFGRADRRTTGSRALPNEPCATWAEFFSTQRLRPLMRIAEATDALSTVTLTEIGRIADDLDDLGGPPEPAARLHGDLWAGNRLVDPTGRSWLIDPAAHGGHREFDLAMMQLFGGFGDEAFTAYDEEFPLADGWRDRIPLHQLAPLMVHAIKFGGGYSAATDEAVRAVRQHRP